MCGVKDGQKKKKKGSAYQTISAVHRVSNISHLLLLLILFIIMAETNDMKENTKTVKLN